MDNLITRLGGRIGLEAITRLHPADSHIPEKTATIMAAAWAEPEMNWPTPDNARPLVLFPPEIVTAEGDFRPPAAFYWRRRRFQTASAIGPERIAPEWWLDNPDWRSGLRDYWRIHTFEGRRLWLFFTPQNPGWYVQGEFA